MKKRILLSALIGTGFVGVLYPEPDWNRRLVVIAVAFFLQLGILFCTILIGLKDATGKREERDQVPLTGQDRSEKG